MPLQYDHISTACQATTNQLDSLTVSKHVQHETEASTCGHSRTTGNVSDRHKVRWHHIVEIEQL
jgi:hypothetical protein